MAREAERREALFYPGAPRADDPDALSLTCFQRTEPGWDCVNVPCKHHDTSEPHGIGDEVWTFWSLAESDHFPELPIVVSLSIRTGIFPPSVKMRERLRPQCVHSAVHLWDPLGGPCEFLGNCTCRNITKDGQLLWARNRERSKDPPPRFWSRLEWVTTDLIRLLMGARQKARFPFDAPQIEHFEAWPFKRAALVAVGSGAR